MDGQLTIRLFFYSIVSDGCFNDAPAPRLISWSLTGSCTFQDNAGTTKVVLGSIAPSIHSEQNADSCARESPSGGQLEHAPVSRTRGLVIVLMRVDPGPPE